ncbi:MAG TPA: hypothetical protein PLT76_06430 [Candidatus Omnitrophota bacterium]|nr:hypothetical protein [Candidatus Omnitrophota bacterium]HPB69141.1 hypothetical protein [Candidatus Omnitrophota bacterium]HQO58342.1 hypothetical protein [Candidatus Omnitrophota bacterium]
MLSKGNKEYVFLHGVPQPELWDKFKAGKFKACVIPEGRPDLQSADKNSRAILKKKMSPVLIADNMAGFMISRNMIKEIWLAYQVGDAHGALCDIGALIYAILGKKHGVPVFCYPAAKKRRFIGKPREIFYFCEKRIAPRGIQGYVPLLEWVPGAYIQRVYE